MNKSIRIRTTPGGNDKYVKVKLDQEFDFIEILSLKLTQEDVYNKFCADYGVVVGRVIVNNGFGVPNAKVSVFIPISEEDKKNPEKSSIYPYTKTSDKNSEGLRYNLLTKTQVNECHNPVGNFPSKREVLDNDIKLEIYEKYYKFTATTNESGDYMIFGVPLGNHMIHVDVDMSDMGVISQRPYDFISKGYSADQFESPTKFNKSNNIDTLSHIKTQDIGVNVVPFWGDEDNCQIGITRVDVDLKYDITPSAIFMGGIFGDSEKNSINKNGRPRKKLGDIRELTTSEGSIEMIRKTFTGEIERFDVKGGRVINENGSWGYQIPMNLDYIITNEFGKLIPTSNPNKGIPTRANVRFRIGLDQTGGEGRLRTRAKYLVPHNPSTFEDSDYEFGENTKDSSFTELKWNKLYSLKSFIPRVQQNNNKENKNFVGLKRLDDAPGTFNPVPYNRIDTDFNPLFTILCLIIGFIIEIASIINTIISIKLGPIGRPLCGNCVQLTCNGTEYKPKCKCKVRGANTSKTQTIDCFQVQLADSLNIFAFEFYNDWLNGSLYSFLLKYKVTKDGKEKFYDYDCESSDNDCDDGYIVDRCAYGGDDDSVRTFGIREGLLKKYDGEFYYPPITRNGGVKLFATDIINLGAILNCDIDNIPTIHEQFLTTTYNLPELEVVLESGLVFDLNCIKIDVDSRQCTNIKRLSEIGVAVDDDSGNIINEEDVDNLFIRNTFAWLNDDSFNNFSEANMNYNDVEYNSFRGFSGININQPVNNSFYFYFGLMSGKTSLDLTNSKYFTKCETFKINNIIIDGNVNDVTTVNGSNGSINVTAEGGVEPYNYFWEGPNGFTSISEDLTNLLVGSYKVTVKDNRNKSNSRVFTVNGPAQLSCFVSMIPETTLGSNDGKILLNNISGGVPPFNMVINSPSNTPIFNQNNLDNNSTLTIDNLNSGVYSYVITDSDGSTCSSNIEITNPPLLDIIITGQDLSCNGDESGQISIEIVTGNAPYTIEYKNSLDEVVEENTLTAYDLSSDTYIVTVKDNLNQTVTGTITLNEPTPLNVTTNINGSNLSISVSNGTAPYSYELTNNNDYFESNDNGNFNNLTTGDYTVTVTDFNGCEETDTFTI